MKNNKFIQIATREPLNILFMVMVMFMVLSCKPSSSEENIREPETSDKYYKFYVLYPKPKDTIQFDLDYSKHLNLLDSLMGYTQQNKPYYVTKLDQEVFGLSSQFYQMFTMEFEKREELETIIQSKEMELAGQDALRISSGGAPIVLIGNRE